MKRTGPNIKPPKVPVKGLLMLLFSVSAGACGVYLSQQYIEREVAQKTATEPVQQTFVEVVVPARNMLRGEIVTSADLVVRDIPEQYADSNTVDSSTYELALGQRMDFDIDEGRPLLWAHLASGVSPTFSGKVQPGLRAMTVRVDDINSISGFLQPGDRVDLLMSYGTDEQERILPLMEKLDVIATGVQTEPDKLSDGQARSFSTITVHVSPRVAQKLTLAQKVGKLTAILRHPDDDAPVEESPLTIAQLLAGSEGKPVKPVKRSKPKAQVAAAPAVQYIIGGQ